VVAEQIPLDTASFRTGVDEDGFLVEHTLHFRETHRLVAGVVSYPFSRAQRLELSGGYRYVGFETERFSDFYSPTTGQFVSSERVELPATRGLRLFEGATAFVHDASIFGATSPILGHRHRIEVSPTRGDIDYTGLLVDSRAYLMPVRPFTFAFRALHYGRYGSGGEDARLQPLFLGYSNLVRGYESGSFSIGECGQILDNDESCPVFDQLLGSRLLVANAELRFPLLGLFGAKNFYGPVPLEGAVFADAGVAWDSREKARFLDRGGTRQFVRSIGAAVRVNVLGFLIAELDYLRPLDRPGKAWSWELNLSPGF
jgi:hypothetical protein